jgi:hypothetical protein
MTLSEFKSKFFSRPTIAPPTTLYVFENEDSADSWIERKYFGSDNRNYKLDMVIQSDMILEYTVKEKWCKAEVQQFYAVEPDVIVIVVEPQESEGET